MEKISAKTGKLQILDSKGKAVNLHLDALDNLQIVDQSLRVLLFLGDKPTSEQMFAYEQEDAKRKRERERVKKHSRKNPGKSIRLS